MTQYIPPLPPQNFVPKVTVVTAQWLNAIDNILQGHVPATGNYQPLFQSGQVQITGPDGNMLSFGDLTFGLLLPNPSGIPCPGLLIGGAGKLRSCIVTDAQSPGIPGIQLIIAAGEVEDNQVGGALLLLGGASNTGAGGASTFQGGTSLSGPAGHTFVQGGNSTNGPAGNLYLSGGLSGTSGGDVHLVMTKVNNVAGSIVVRVNSTILYQITETGALFIGSSGAGLSGQVLISNGPNASPTWSPTTGGILLYPQTAAEIAAGVSPSDYSYPSGNVLRYGAVGNGVADDSFHIQSALNVGTQPGGPVIILPSGFKFKITSYLQIGSNTQIELRGMLQLTNRSAGLYSNGASNISIRGFGTGQIQDSSVVSNYQYQASPNGNSFPAIHLRSSSKCLIEDLIISYCARGILISDFTSTTGPFSSGQAASFACRVRGNNVQFCEYSAIGLFEGMDSGFYENYVYRCGDGGLWMMGCQDSEIVNNHRISPYAVPADVAAFGSNNPAHPTTWNDEQGIELENCHNVLVSGNVVKGFWAQGIDVKNACNRILVSNNRVSDCENGGIVVREGDAIRNAVHKVSIIGNTISNQGLQQYNINNFIQGAIRIGECFIAEVIDNVIYAYQNTVASIPGISCLGTASGGINWNHDYYAANPHNASIVVSGNCFGFKSVASENIPEPQYQATTSPAIVINGDYDSLVCVGNKISTEAYSPTDRVGVIPAVVINYVSANGTFYPTSANVSSNEISGWGNHGILVNGLPAAVCSGLAVNGNSIGNCKGSGIVLVATNKAVCNSNVINQNGSGAGFPAINLIGSAGNLIDGVVCCNNALTGRYDGGGSAMTYGIQTSFAANLNAQNNVIANGASVAAFNIGGNHNFSGTTGFWRSGAGTPNGVMVAYWQGELYFDSAGQKWWAASGFNSTVWTQLSN